MRTIFRFFLYGFATAGFIGLAMIVLLIVVAASSAPGRPELPDRAVLALTIDGPVAERSNEALTALVGGRTLSLHGIVRTLERAAQDDRIAAVVMRLGGAALTLAQAQEIRDALHLVAGQDKPILAYADSYGLGDRLSIGYYLATAAQEVWLQPSGDVGLVGISLEMPFLRAALDGLGIEPQFERRAEYKTAVDFLTETGMTGPNREALEAIAVSWLSQVVVGISEGRGLHGEDVRRLVDRGPFTADDALAERLVDQLGYWDEARDQALALAGEGADLFPADSYLAAAGPDPRDTGPRVALVMAEGPIVRGDGPAQQFGGDRSIASETFADVLREAIDDDDIKGIVLRINSPGGSYVASDTLWREVQRAREAGKPVIASLGDVAASGGYFLAMGADTVVAQPATLTGSIGVVGGKLSLAGLWTSLDITWDRAEAGTTGGLFSLNRPFDAAERRRFVRQLDRIYDDFTAKAAAARGMAPTALQAVAKGRVWTGADARRRDLVDALGGLSMALALMEDRLALPPDQRLDVTIFPRKRGALEQVTAWISGETSVFANLDRAAAVARQLDPILQVIERGLAIGRPDQPVRADLPARPRP